jgi:hypothetical protein
MLYRFLHHWPAQQQHPARKDVRDGIQQLQEVFEQHGLFQFRKFVQRKVLVERGRRRIQQFREVQLFERLQLVYRIEFVEGYGKFFERRRFLQQRRVVF